jgi:hypothetical protein
MVFSRMGTLGKKRGEDMKRLILFCMLYPLTTKTGCCGSKEADPTKKANVHMQDLPAGQSNNLQALPIFVAVELWKKNGITPLAQDQDTYYPNDEGHYYTESISNLKSPRTIEPNRITICNYLRTDPAEGHAYVTCNIRNGQGQNASIATQSVTVTPTSDGLPSDDEKETVEIKEKGFQDFYLKIAATIIHN